MVLKGKTVVTLPGCPANPYILLGTVAAVRDPRARCPRSTTRAGRCSPTAAPSTSTARGARTSTPAASPQQFGDEGHRQGCCLYKLGCKGPADPRQLLDPALRRGAGRLADRHRPPLRRLHRAGARLPRAAPRHRRHRAADAARHLPAASTRSRAASAPIATGVGGLVGGALLGAGYRLREEARRQTPARRRSPSHRPPTREVTAVNLDRRTGAARAGGSGAATGGRRRARAAAARAPEPPAEAVGMLYDTTRCIGCKACVVACREANDLAARREPATASTTPRSTSTAAPRTSSSSTRRATRVSVVKAQCMHCVDPACVGACMLGAAAQGRDTGIVDLRPRALRRLPLLPDGLPLQRPEVRVRARRCRRSSSASCAATASTRSWPTAASAATRATGLLLRGVPAQAGHLRQARGAPRRGPAPARRRTPAPTSRSVYGETEAGGTQVLYLSHVPFEKLGLPDFGPRGRPARSPTPIQDGIYQGLRRARGALRGPRRGAVPQPEATTETGTERRWSREHPRAMSTTARSAGRSSPGPSRSCSRSPASAASMTALALRRRASAPSAT